MQGTMPIPRLSMERLKALAEGTDDSTINDPTPVRNSSFLGGGGGSIFGGGGGVSPPPTSSNNNTSTTPASNPIEAAKAKWKSFRGNRLSVANNGNNERGDATPKSSTGDADSSVDVANQNGGGGVNSVFRRLVSSLDRSTKHDAMDEVTAADYEAQIEALLQNVGVAQTTNRELYTEINILKCQLETYESELPALRSQVQRLKGELQRQTDLQELAHTQQQMQLSTIQELEVNIRELKEQLSTAHAHVSSRSSHIETIAMMHDELEESRRLTDRYNAAMDDVIQSQTEVSALKLVVKEKEKCLEAVMEVGASIADASSRSMMNDKATIISLRRTVRALVDEVTKVRSLLHVQKEATTNSQRRCQILQKDLDNVDQRIADAHSQQAIALKKAQQNIRELQEQLKVAKEQQPSSPTTCVDMLQTLQSENEVLVKKLADLQQVKWQLEQQVEHLMKNVSGRTSGGSGKDVDKGLQRLVEHTLERNMQLERDVVLLGDDVSELTSKLRQVKEAYRRKDEATLETLLG
eukprot:PhF_6_TR26249/c0_g1_i1/m.37536